MQEIFRRLAHKSASMMGSSLSFMAALCLIVCWLACGPFFHYSDTWQLVINTGTTIITFLMVFLIQNTQNRDSHAIHLKLDELIRSHKQARNRLLALEDLSDAEMQALQLEFEQLRDRKSEVSESLRGADPDGRARGALAAWGGAELGGLIASLARPRPLTWRVASRPGATGCLDSPELPG